MEEEEERRRWREAATKLNLFLCQKNNPEADLQKGEWKQVTKDQASPKAIRDCVSKALRESREFIYLFDSVDEDKIRQETANYLDPWKVPWKH